jgi:hypothetical protein
VAKKKPTNQGELALEWAPPKASEILERAVELIMEKGWVNHSHRGARDQFSVLAALETAASEIAEIEEGLEAWILAIPAREFLAETVGLNHHWLLMPWERWRTKRNEVLEPMKLAKEHAESKGC